MQDSQFPIHRVTDAEQDILFVQREEALERNTYEMEQAFLSIVSKGDVAGLAPIAARLGVAPLSTGNLSCSDLRQAQYLGVALITLVTRAAIESGVPQAEAYSLSDECILRVDRLLDPDAVLQELLAMAERFTLRIAACKSRYSRLVKRAMDYVSSHLHGDVSLPSIAAHCAVSPSYLSREFHAETGRTLHAYILEEKLSEARTLLREKQLSCLETSNILGFSSQSHFIACYKRQYGVTPGRYRRCGEASAESPIRKAR